MSADAIVPGAKNPQALNRYAYVLGNPLKFVDPSGHAEENHGGSLQPWEIDEQYNSGRISAATWRKLKISFGREHPNYDFFNDSRLNDAQKVGWYGAQAQAAQDDGAKKSIDKNTFLGLVGVIVGSIAGGGSDDSPDSASSEKTASSTFDVEVKLSKSKYPQTAGHIEDAQSAGKPSILTIDRPQAQQRRSESLSSALKVAQMDLDEYPPAMFREGGTGASVRAVDPRDNRGAGATIGNVLRKHPDGTRVKISVVK
jgi:hypothetical protein